MSTTKGVAMNKTDIDLDRATKDVLGEIELSTMQYTLADAIREGSEGTTQVRNWGDGQETACALTAAVIAAEKRGYKV